MDIVTELFELKKQKERGKAFYTANLLGKAILAIEELRREVEDMKKKLSSGV